VSEYKTTGLPTLPDDDEDFINPCSANFNNCQTVSTVISFAAKYFHGVYIQIIFRQFFWRITLLCVPLNQRMQSARALSQKRPGLEFEKRIKVLYLGDTIHKVYSCIFVSMKELTLHIPETVDENSVKMQVAALLFEQGILSSGQAADLAGVSKRYFLENGGKYGVSVFGETLEDLKNLNLIHG
jgi:predicted HTH domain antitoxin